MKMLAGLATRGAIFLAAICLLLALPLRNAHATDGLDVAVDLFSVALAEEGIYVGETEKEILKSVVRSVEKGATFPDAMKDAVVNTALKNLPPEVKEIAKCVVTGGNVAGCAQTELLKQLPDDVRTLAECALKNSANPGQCLISKLPPDAQGMATCISSRRPVAECMREELIRRLPETGPVNAKAMAECLTRAKTEADIAACGTAQVQEAIRNLQSSVANANTARDRFFKPQPNILENVINVVIAIQQEDWQKVVENGGAAVAKAVVHVILDNFPATKPLMPVLGPLINVMIENRIDLATDLIAAAKAGDVGAATRIVVEAYYAFQLENICSLPIIPTAIREAFCGPVAAVIHEIAKIAQGAVNEAGNFLERAIKDPLGIPEETMKLPVKIAEGVWEWLGKRIEDASREAANKKDDCGTAEKYYASRFANCLPAAAYQKLTDPASFAAFEGALYQDCRNAFARCYFRDAFAAICDPMRRLFNDQAQKLFVGLRESATIRAQEARHFVELHRKEACSCGVVKNEFLEWAYTQFINECGSAIDRQLPLQRVNDTRVPAQEMRNGAFAPNCVPRPGEIPNFSAVSASATACRLALSPASFRKAAAGVCSYGGDGTKMRLLEPNCRPGAVEAVTGKPIPADVSLKDNVTISKGPSAAAKVLEAVLSCDGGTVVNGECRCGRGEVAKKFSNRTVCMPGLSSSSIGGGGGAAAIGGLQPAPVACTGGRVGTPPNCYCPAGTQWTGRNCLRLAAAPSGDPCPQGYALYQGRCVQVASPQPKMFDPGTLFDWRPKPRPTPPANVGGGTDGTNKPGTAPTPIPQPSGGGIPPVNTTTLKPGGLGAANALRCNAPQTWNAREGRCVCANGLLGANCDQSPGLR